MKYFLLVPKDNRWNNWILHHESDEGVRLRSRYAHLACHQCGKLDEMAAIQLGIDPDVRIRTRFDFLGVDDGFVCVSSEFLQVLEDGGVKNVSTMALPGDERFSLLLPEREAHVDLERSGMEFHRKCSVCGRFRETCLFPALDAVNIQEYPLSFLCPSAPFENVGGRVFWFLGAAPLVDLLKKHRIRGIDFTRAY